MKKKISNELINSISEDLKENGIGKVLTSEHISKMLENERISLLEKIFGKSLSSKDFIAFSVAVLTIIGAIISMFFVEEYLEVWKMAATIISGCLGYIFGGNRKE